MLRTLALAAALAAPLFLAGCSDGGEGLVRNACTDHPRYGSGNPHVTLETTLGAITAEIFVDQAPITGMNFVKLAEAGTFNGTPFHRIITNFMMQGGDHTLGNGQGGDAHPDCADANGNVKDEFDVDLRHEVKGILSMANTGAPDSGSSQFFITFRATSWLDAYNEDGSLKACGTPGVSCHAVFGKVTAGLDVLDRVNAEAASSSGTPRIPVTLVGAAVDWP